MSRPLTTTHLATLAVHIGEPRTLGDTPDGTPHVTARYAIELTDGTLLHIDNSGTVQRNPFTGTTRPKIDAPLGDWGWLNDAVLAGTIGPLAGPQAGVRIELHQVHPVENQ